jgi:cytochrome oxidase assembly protein ShyY1
MLRSDAAPTLLSCVAHSLIDRRTQALSAEPVDLVTFLKSRPAPSASVADPSVPAHVSDALDASADMCRVRTRGRLAYERTMLLGPRNPPSADASSTAGQGVGYFLVTPLVIDDGRTILVNRGWCSKDKIRQASMESANERDAVEVIGVMRKGEAVSRTEGRE